MLWGGLWGPGGGRARAGGSGSARYVSEPARLCPSSSEAARRTPPRFGFFWRVPSSPCVIFTGGGRGRNMVVENYVTEIVEGLSLRNFSRLLLRLLKYH